MDDMKRLIEKYKQELMEYGRAAAPKKDLTFPEMIAEEPRGVPEREAASAEPPAPPVAEEPAPVEEALNCQGEPVPGTEYVPPQHAEEEPEDGSEDYEELTPVTFGGEPAAPPEPPEPPAPPEVEAPETDVPPAPPEQPRPAETAEKPAGKPKIIGYVDNDDGTFDYDSIFGDMLGEPRVSDRRVTPADAPRYDELPSQRGISEGNTADSMGRGRELEPSCEVSGVTDNSPQEPRPQPAPAGSVSAKRAERLSERPANGRQGEQLTGRSFEITEPLENPRDDIRPLHDGNAPADLPHGSPAYSNLQSFVPEEQYDGDGENCRGNNFRFQVYTARDALPVKGAVCVIMKKSDGGYVTLHRLVTDISGQTVPVSLPAPSASLSQYPGNTVQPYALYDAEVSADGYDTVEIKNIPVFEGVLSVQRVAMIPRTEENVTEIIDEQETNGGE